MGYCAVNKTRNFLWEEELAENVALEGHQLKGKYSH